MGLRTEDFTAKALLKEAEIHEDRAARCSAEGDFVAARQYLVIARRYRTHAGEGKMGTEEKTLTCDMREDCAAPVTMIEDSGFVYCEAHGLRRRQSGRRCRKLRSHELKKLARGETLARY